MSAETPEALLADFDRLADPLAISTHLEQGTGELVALVKAWLNRHQNWLLIFDNAETLEVVRDYVPTESRNGCILLTTQATTAGSLTEILPLEEMQVLETKTRSHLLTPMESCCCVW